MSRRRGEFEHRTTIFEGAFRAWSHLGGLDPELLEHASVADLDPLNNPIRNDPRLSGKSGTITTEDGSTRREYPYEPLPRAGLAHPFVQAILSPWLGPDADNEAIQLGLTTLRTWWQHRRKGESGSAIAALGTEKMKGVVEGYTRHFFTLAHCIVVNDRVQPPRGLLSRMKDLEKKRSKQNKTIHPATNEVLDSLDAVSAIRADLSDPNLTPLVKLHLAQRRQMETSNVSALSSSSNMNSVVSAGGYDSGITGVSAPILHQAMAGKCIPGKVDLPGVLEAVNHHATQLAHRGFTPNEVGSSNVGLTNGPDGQPYYGDPNTTPVVFVSSTGDIQIAMKVDGITCAHCVKIVETVLRGCNGNKSPIAGLLDAAADEKLGRVILKIDEAAAAKRIAFEASRNLSMVGYTAEPLSMGIVGSGADPVSHADLGALATAFEVVAATEPTDVFDWTIPCTCPDNGIVRGDCARHSQMNKRIFDAFTAREQQVTEYMAGCGMKYGMDCTCGPNCRCKNCPLHEQDQQPSNNMGNSAFLSALGLTSVSEYSAALQGGGNGVGGNNDHQPQIGGSLSFNTFDMGPPAAPFLHNTSSMFSLNHDNLEGSQQQNTTTSMLQGNMSTAHAENQQNSFPSQQHHRLSSSRAQRNPSVLSYGNRGSIRDGGLRSSLRGMSITSETTFGRAMSGLSALSIDWENLDDFDLDVDHSAHINQTSSGTGGAHHSPNGGGGGIRRTSATRRSIMSTGSQDGGGTQVSFKV